MAIMNGNFREYRLDNGLYVAIQNTPTQTVRSKIKVFHGSLHEKPGEEGVAHFLEHVIMKGGSKNYSPSQAKEILDGLGEYNAFTGHDHTFFPTGILPHMIEEHLKVHAEMIFDPRLDDRIIEKERQRVLREIADYKSNPGMQDWEEYQESIVGKESPLLYDVLGTEESVLKSKKEDLQKFHQRGYSPKNSELIIVGALPKNIDALVEKYFGSIKGTQGEKYVYPSPRPIEKPIILHRCAKELLNQSNPEQSSAQLSVSFQVPDNNSNSWIEMNIIASMLNKKLYERVSAKEGLAYGVSCEYSGTKSAGTIFFGGKISAARSDDAIDAMFDEIRMMHDEPPSRQEFEWLKMKNAYAIARSFETNEGHINSIEQKRERGITPDMIIDMAEKVDLLKVWELANQYLPANRKSGKYALLLRDPLKEDQ